MVNTKRYGYLKYDFQEFSFRLVWKERKYYACSASFAVRSLTDTLREAEAAVMSSLDIAEARLGAELSIAGCADLCLIRASAAIRFRRPRSSRERVRWPRAPPLLILIE